MVTPSLATNISGLKRRKKQEEWQVQHGLFDETSDFFYHCPKDNRTNPIEPRDASRMLVCNINNQLIKDDRFLFPIICVRAT